MIHYYTVRRYVRGVTAATKEYKYLILCTKKWLEPTDYITMRYGVPRRQISFTSIPYNATCPECLKLLIPKFELKVNTMKARLFAETLVAENAKSE